MRLHVSEIEMQGLLDGAQSYIFPQAQKRSIQLLTKVEAESKPWGEALEGVVQGLPEGTLSRFVDELEVPDYALREFLKKCQPTTRQILRRYPRYRQCSTAHNAARLPPARAPSS